MFLFILLIFVHEFSSRKSYWGKFYGNKVDRFLLQLKSDEEFRMKFIQAYVVSSLLNFYDNSFTFINFVIKMTLKTFLIHQNGMFGMLDVNEF